MESKRGIALVSISALLTGLSFNHPQLFFLTWFSLCPFLYVLSRSTKKASILNAFIFGAIYYFTIIFWVANVTILGLIFLLGYLCLYPVMFSFLARYFFKKRFAIVTIASVWVLLELLKENIWCGFSWGNIGYSQYLNRYIIQIADIFGVKSISFLVVMVNVLFFEIISKNKNIIKKLFFVASVLFFCTAYSHYKLNTFITSGEVTLSLVQPNVGESEKYNLSSGSNIVARLKKLSRQTEEGSLVIFPEAAWPFVIKDDDRQILPEFVAEIKRRSLIGLIQHDGKFHNRASLFNSSGKLVAFYDKLKLVPFGEYVPLRKYLSFIPVINSIGDMHRGREIVVFPYGDQKFSVLICFEDIFSDLVRDFSSESDFLINITNDAWFMGEPQASQHLAIMVFRAIENRISIARCANTGISGWVSFKGDINKLKKQNSEVFFEGVMNFKLPLNDQRSFFNAYGGMVSFLYVFLLGLGFIHHEE
ncbi:MAG: apolipoprotein N-acyltransferase [Candidatus Omnitrophica bacterium]|nr:apolipoprotein N-acyltransferase [Candidatus Omnitrophota bacterium]